MLTRLIETSEPDDRVGGSSTPITESLDAVLRRLPPGRVSFAGDPTPLSDEEARRLVASVKWCHRFEVRPGLVTPGAYEFHPGPVCDFLGVPSDLTGRRVMDIGSWDGPVAIELERRGGDCVALDIQDPQRIGFAVARQVSGSRVPYVQASVYDLEQLGLRDFDHIVFKGVFYHLKHPILAFEQIAKALKVGGRVYIEGETPLNYVEDLDGRKVDLDLKRLNELRVPVCFVYPNLFKGGSNWFVPNLPCMESWLRACGMKVVSMTTWESDTPPAGGQRLIGVAERIAEQVGEVEHTLF